MKVIDYCAEEVRRQGHDITELDGIQRTAWMLNAWTFMMDYTPAPITTELIRQLGKRVEPSKNRFGFRKCGVRVGSDIKPDWQSVPRLLSEWIQTCDIIEPLEAYRQFEQIHPFVDGNGRVGKILLNSFNRSMLEPIFPPNDFWGYWIQNP